MPAAPPLPELLTPAEVAAELGISADRVRELAARGRLPAIRLSPHRLSFRAEDVAAFKAERAKLARLTAGSPADDLLPLASVADRLGVTLYTVYRWVRLGRLPVRKVAVLNGSFAYRVRKADVVAFIAQASTR